MNKAQLARLAIEVRAEVGIGVAGRLDPYALADAYGIDVLPLSNLDCTDSVLGHFARDRRTVFSGALVPLSDGSTLIVENDSHTLERRRSTASHEMSHVVLEHPFGVAVMDGKGCRLVSSALEKEAAYLSGELLLPSEQARRLAVRGLSDEEVAEAYGVSVPFARWRMQVSGGRIIAERARAKRRAPGGRP